MTHARVAAARSTKNAVANNQCMLFSIISAILLILSFPNFNLSFLAFIGFVPLFFALGNKSPKKAFLISYFCGFIFYLGTLYWLYNVTIIGLIILCLYLALYFGVFGFSFALLQKTENRIQKTEIRTRKSKKRCYIFLSSVFCPLFSAFRYLFFISSIWVILEYIQAYLFTGFGWLLLGYSQYRNLPLIQIADFSGVYGVSFVVMMVNVAVWKKIKALIETRNQSTETRSLSSVFCLLSSAALILVLVYGYGIMRENKGEGGDNKGVVKVSVIQGNIPQELKWDPDAAEMILKKYTALTRMAALDNPDLIIWPETSFPGFFETDKEMTDEVLNLAKEVNTQILIGANSETDLDYFNSAVLVSSQGKFIDRYDKIHLVPFGEYVPFSNRFPALHKLVLGQLGEFTPGKDFKVFIIHHPSSIIHYRFAVLICFEDIFPELSRQFVKNGAQFLIVITNDAWYGKSGAAYQHAANSVFRAIENRVPIVRCANTGYSCFIDSRGRIYDSVEEKGINLFVTGHKTSLIFIE